MQTKKTRQPVEQESNHEKEWSRASACSILFSLEEYFSDGTLDMLVHQVLLSLNAVFKNTKIQKRIYDDRDCSLRYHIIVITVCKLVCS